MPTVVADFDALNLYALANGVVIATQLMTTAVCGMWVDARGVKPALTTGISLLIVGLLVATVSPSIWVFIAGRFIQGLGGGLCVVPLYVLVGRLVPVERQPSFFAAFSAAWVVPSLIGPLLSGFLVDNVHWRVVFGIAPVLLTIMLGVAMRMFTMFPHMEFTGTWDRFPLVATMAFGAGVGALGLQIVSGLDREKLTVPVGAATIGIIALTFMCARFLLPAGTLLLRRGIPATIALRGLLNGAFLTVDIYLPLLLQRVHGWSPTMAGLTLTVGSITWALGSFAQARITDVSKRPAAMLLGSLGTLAGLAIALPVAFAATPGWVALVAWAVGGVGVGLAYPATSTHALNLTKPERHGAISSGLNIADTLSLSVMLGLAGIAFALFGGGGSISYLGVIGTMCVVAASAMYVATRVRPVGNLTASGSSDVESGPVE